MLYIYVLVRNDCHIGNNYRYHKDKFKTATQQLGSLYELLPLTDKILAEFQVSCRKYDRCRDTLFMSSY